MKRNIIVVGLAAWIVLGTVGALVPSVREISWAIAGVGGITGWLLLAARFAHQARDVVAVGFVAMALGEVISFAGLNSDAAGQQSAFVGGITLYVPALLLISLPTAYSMWSRAAGVIAAVLFAIIAAQNYLGQQVNPDAQISSAAYVVAMIAVIGWMVAVWQQEAAPSQVAAAAPSRG